MIRAARVLGLCLPSKELYSNVQRRLRGVCEGHSSDNCLQTRGTEPLRVLNKRFSPNIARSVQYIHTSRDQCNTYSGVIGKKSSNFRQNDEVQLNIKCV